MMTKVAHRVYVLFLFSLSLLILAAGGVSGAEYYLTSLTERPFHPLYEGLKPSGLLGHGYGVVGTLMIAAGVILYSGRKRVRALSGVGKLQHFLEFHIFLCLTGPVLVLYHTTFKFGGLVGVSFWSMAAVVVSGILGRYIYVQIPRGIQGNELSVMELNRENDQLRQLLEHDYQLSSSTIARIDLLGLPLTQPAEMSLLDMVRFFFLEAFGRRRRLRRLLRSLPPRAALARHLRRIVLQRLLLLRRIAFLEKFQRIFRYWHVVHLPFTIVMVIILLVHVAVAVAFGYRWIL